MRVPADAEDGEGCPKYVSRIVTGVHVRCMVEGIVFGICNFEIWGLVTQRAGRLSVGRYFRSMSSVSSFMVILLLLMLCVAFCRFLNCL